MNKEDPKFHELWTKRVKFENKLWSKDYKK